MPQSSTTLADYANLDRGFSKHGIADLVAVPAVGAVKGHVFEYHVGEIKVGHVAAFHAGKWHATQANMRFCAGQSVHQHVCQLLATLACSWELYDVIGHLSRLPRRYLPSWSAIRGKKAGFQLFVMLKPVAVMLQLPLVVFTQTLSPLLRLTPATANTPLARIGVL